MSTNEFVLAAESYLSKVPAEVREYFTASDGLGQFSARQNHPHLEDTLKAPTTRMAIVNYLASEEPWHDHPGFTIGALTYLQTEANAAELARINHLTKHPNALIRLRMFEYMMDIYYPPRDVSRMASMFQAMLADPDDTIRVQAVRWIEGLKMQERMRETLVHWLKFANDHGWTASESYSMIQHMLTDSHQSSSRPGM
jgi:hypothetical protein